MTKSTSVWAISAMELDMAPLPNAAARPATEGACQARAA
jgi:hypothetical protein